MLIGIMMVKCRIELFDGKDTYKGESRGYLGNSIIFGYDQDGVEVCYWQSP